MFSDPSLSSSSSPTHHSQQQSPGSNLLFPLRKTGSTSSLASMINFSSGEQHIRVCVDCHKFLERRDQQIEQRTNRPTILLYYEKMKLAIEEAKRLVPVYCKLTDSLNLGETNYHLKDAQDLRMKLMKITETIDVYSKKILMNGLKNDPPPHPKEIQLQKMVRQSASSFLQDNMVGLVKLPTEEQLQQLQESRRQMLQKQILVEKQEALLAQQRISMVTTPVKKLTTIDNYQPISSRTSSNSKKELEESQAQNVVDIDEGWASQTVSPSTHSSFNKGHGEVQEEDPMVQQMNNIKLFIKQARAAHKYDEVEIPGSKS
ncbi:Rabenosyn-5 [Nymphon striatum]|nr:Rabenosyn-5 [Nymphon striatum]